MRRIIIGILIGIVAFLLFIMYNGGDRLKEFGRKTQQAGERLQDYRERIKDSVDRTKERIEELKEDVEKKVRQTLDTVENRIEKGL